MRLGSHPERTGFIRKNNTPEPLPIKEPEEGHPRYRYSTKTNPGVITGTKAGRGLSRGLLKESNTLMAARQTDPLDQMLNSISTARFAPYQREAQAYGTYAWNIALCESFYPALHSLEISLRNGINEAAIAVFGGQDWLTQQVLMPQEEKSIQNATANLRRQGKSLTPNNYVGGLNFGFWVSLFNDRYHQGKWPGLLASVFPNMPNRQRSLKNLGRRLEEVRTLRNRVFHHEPVWHYSDLQRQHGLIIETIGWINSAMRRFVEMLDRFPETYAKGAAYYEQELVSALKADQKENFRFGG